MGRPLDSLSMVPIELQAILFELPGGRETYSMDAGDSARKSCVSTSSWSGRALNV